MASLSPQACSSWRFRFHVEPSHWQLGELSTVPRYASITQLQCIPFQFSMTCPILTLKQGVAKAYGQAYHQLSVWRRLIRAIGSAFTWLSRRLGSGHSAVFYLATASASTNSSPVFFGQPVDSQPSFTQTDRLVDQRPVDQDSREATGESASRSANFDLLQMVTLTERKIVVQHRQPKRLEREGSLFR
ncbi:unnamed protein product [Protopolystoma xenopodis]|uniref:Uncharacterized protein n=1 Tax=Protopolystoma xenopodis TaxID=117903 RepID=A0A448X468_9PLAT|nr:unnamed protein product [Protopolystoma xenopodis]